MLTGIHQQTRRPPKSSTRSSSSPTGSLCRAREPQRDGSAGELYSSGIIHQRLRLSLSRASSAAFFSPLRTVYSLLE